MHTFDRSRVRRWASVACLIVVSAMTAVVLPLPGRALWCRGGCPFGGVNHHGLWSNWTEVERDLALDKVVDAGVTWIRVDVGWHALQEVAADQISWWYVDRVERLVDAAPPEV